MNRYFFKQRIETVKPFLKRNKKTLITGTSVFLLLLFCSYLSRLPSPLFETSTSVVLEDRKGDLLGARIADDGQWRFPRDSNVPRKFEKAILQFEDERFYYHPGIDPLALIRAVYQNIREGEIVSGASTLSMQVIRLARDNPPRTFWNKFVESLQALRLELTHTKAEILSLYAWQAPFGGNVVGLNAASWRYYNQKHEDLTWGEAATLAVLPNNPTLVRPGKHEGKLKKKRNRLLRRIHEASIIDSVTYQLARQEAIPGKPKPLPQKAPRLLTRVTKEDFQEGKQQASRMQTTLKSSLQRQVTQILKQHHNSLKGNEIHNAAALIAEVETGDVLAYKGNIGQKDRYGKHVDVINAKRSTGSVLKPFLYAGMLDEGHILPESLIADIPTIIGSFSPENYNLGYDGAVPAKRALARSLNIPAVKMLQQYSVEKFHYLLRKMGMTTLSKAPDHYGLSLALGGADGSLWDLSGMYASMARALTHANATNGFSAEGQVHSLNYKLHQDEKTQKHKTKINTGAIYKTFQALLEVDRPSQEHGWRSFSSSRPIAWKTGTSFGFRDAWAIGVTPDHVVGVWVGNADGEGRPGITGLKAASPILFDIFSRLPVNDHWFQEPEKELTRIPVCSKSGYRKGRYCPNPDTQYVPKSCLKVEACPYHQLVHLGPEQAKRVSSRCMAPHQMRAKPWFVLPTGIARYYQKAHADYKPLPPFKKGCRPSSQQSEKMAFVYPQPQTELKIPVELDGKKGEAVFEVVHRNKDANLYWHLDGQFQKETESPHQLAIKPPPGDHLVTVVDPEGNSVKRKFEVVE